MTRGEALRLAALLHDIAKPRTRGVRPDGRVTFVGHDSLGAEMVRRALRRLRTSERLADYVAALTRYHLRLGFLVHQRPLSRRSVWRYLTETAPYEIDVTLLTVADRLATRGRNADAAIAAHLALSRAMLRDALALRAAPPEPIVRGDDLARALCIAPGPELGRLAGSARGGPLRRRHRHPRRGHHAGAGAAERGRLSRRSARSHTATARATVP